MHGSTRDNPRHQKKTTRQERHSANYKSSLGKYRASEGYVKMVSVVVSLKGVLPSAFDRFSTFLTSHLKLGLTRMGGPNVALDIRACSTEHLVAVWVWTGHIARFALALARLLALARFSGGDSRPSDLCPEIRLDRLDFVARRSRGGMGCSRGALLDISCGHLRGTGQG